MRGIMVCVCLTSDVCVYLTSDVCVYLTSHSDCLTGFHEPLCHLTDIILV